MPKELNAAELLRLIEKRAIKMRKELQKIGTENRFRFSGKFVRFGVKRGWEGVEETTILLQNIKLLASENQVANHLWFNLTGGFENAINDFLGTTYETKQEEVQKMLLERKAVFEFDGRIGNYEKGWQGRQAEETREWKREKDWKISRPTKIEVKGVNEGGEGVLRGKCLRHGEFVGDAVGCPDCLGEEEMQTADLEEMRKREKEQDYLLAVVAMEFGFRCHENGLNLEMAKARFEKTYQKGGR